MKDNEQGSEEFLIAEFNALQQRASDYERLKNNRVNFFLVVVAASIAMMPTMIDKFQAYEWFAAGFAALTVLLIGLFTLTQVVEYSISVVTFYRRAGRIRRWYVEQDRRIGPFVAFSPRDDRPRINLGMAHVSLRGGDAIVIAVNSMAVGVVSVAVMQIAPVNQTLAVAFGITFVLVSWLLQYQWVKHKLVTANKKAGQLIHFPYTEEIKNIYKI